ncbi:MFS transporter [Ralstonia solanacearum]|uniref:MFS transporter n=1 Tax=Ralstonia solanacearum TaxID=305 RepID=UPI002F938775
MSAVIDRLPMRVMIPLFCVVAIDAIGMGVILPLLPFYSQHFGASPFAIGALVAVFSLGQIIAAPTLGKLSDRLGRKIVLVGSQLGTFASLVLLASAGNLLVVFLARIVDGVTSGNLSVASAYAIDHSTPKNRRQAIGMISAGVGVGMMVGPSLAAGLSHISMTAPIWGAALLSALSLVVNLIFLPNAEKHRTGDARPQTLSLRQTLRMPGTLPVLIVLGLFYVGFAMYVSQFALFLQAHYAWNGHAFGPREVGYIFTASGFVNIIVQAAGMKKLERLFPDSVLCAFSLLLFCAGLGVLSIFPGLAALAVGLLLASVGTAMSRPSLMAALSMTSSPQQQGALMGLSSALMAISNIVGPLAAGTLIQHGLYLGWSVAIACLMAAGGITVFVLAHSKKWPSHRHLAEAQEPLQRSPA